MSIPRRARARTAARAGAIALAVGLLAVGISSLGGRRSGPPSALLNSSTGVLISSSSTGFTISSSISSSATRQISALLYPGVQRYLWYTVFNARSVPITVTSLHIAAVTAPATCPASELDLRHAAFTGALVVAAKIGHTDGTSRVAVPISLVNAGNESRCENTSFDFTYAGTAAYSERHATVTVLTSSKSPSSFGELVTLRSTTTATSGRTPGGSADFYLGSPSGAHSLLAIERLDASGMARLRTRALPLGALVLLYVTYQASATDTASTSATLAQVVQAAPTCVSASARQRFAGDRNRCRGSARPARRS